MSIAFLLTSFAMAAVPGAGVVYTVAAAVSGGRRAGVVAAFGSTLGIVPHALAAVTGLAALLQASATAFIVVKYLGVAYLLYLAVSILRDRGTIAIDADRAPRPAAKVVASAILVNLLNPKLAVFFVAFLPQFVHAGQPGSAATMLLLSAVFMLITFVVFAGYALAAALVRERVLTRPRVLAWLRRVFAGSFAGLGATLALTD